MNGYIMAAEDLLGLSMRRGVGVASPLFRKTCHPSVRVSPLRFPLQEKLAPLRSLCKPYTLSASRCWSSTAGEQSQCPQQDNLRVLEKVPPHRSRFLSYFLVPVAKVLEFWFAWSIRNHEVDRAERAMRRALRLRERAYGNMHPDLCYYWLCYGQCLQFGGHLSEAYTVFDRVMQISAKYDLKEKHIALGATHGAAKALQYLGKKMEAEALYRKAIDLVAAIYPIPEGATEKEKEEFNRSNEQVQDWLLLVKCELAVLLAQMGKHMQAWPLNEELFRNGCTVQAGHPFFHSHLHNSKYWRFRLLQKWNGLIQEENEKNARRELTKTFGEKEGSYIKTKEYKFEWEGWTPTRKKERKKESLPQEASNDPTPEFLPSKELQRQLEKIQLNFSQKEYELQKDLRFRKVVDTLSTRLGTEHPALCNPLYYMAYVYMENKLYDEAEPMIKRILAIQKRETGPFSVPTATALSLLANLCLNRKDFSNAERLMLSALEIKREVLGNGHLEVGVLEYEMGMVYQQIGNFLSARYCLKRAQRIFGSIPVTKLIDGRNEHPWMVATLPRLQHLEEIEREAMQQFQQHLQQTIGDQGGEQNTPQPQNILNEPGKGPIFLDEKALHALEKSLR